MSPIAARVMVTAESHVARTSRGMSPGRKSDASPRGTLAGGGTESGLAGPADGTDNAAAMGAGVATEATVAGRRAESGAGVHAMMSETSSAGSRCGRD